MKLLSLSCLFIFFQFHDHGSAIAPDFIRPCNTPSSKCLTKATQDAIPEFVKGIPNLGVPVLDPFVIDRLTIPLSGINVTFTQGKVSGFKKSVVDNVAIDFKKKVFELEFHTNLTIKGLYEAVGRILVFPINGNGDAKLKLTNLRMKVIINMKFRREKNQLYVAVKSYTYTFSYGDRVTFDLKNLFKGNPELSTTVLNFLNENWKTVSEEFGKPIVDYSVELAVKTVEKFFFAVPYNELYVGNLDDLHINK